jgi:hypothetical protein
MGRIKGRKPSPAMVISIVALMFAVAGTSVAAVATISVLSKKEKRQTRKIARDEIKKAAPGLSVARAGNAGDAATLGGEPPSTFQTRASSNKAVGSLPLSANNTTVLSTTITIPSTKTVIAFASIEAFSDGGNNDDLTCNLEIAGANGLQQSTDVNDGLSNAASLPLTQARTLGAGTHTVLAECFRTGTGSVAVERRSLSVVATG